MNEFEHFQIQKYKRRTNLPSDKQQTKSEPEFHIPTHALLVL